MTETLKICICGAGNASHAFAGILSSKGYHVNVFSNFGDEATRWKQACDKGIKVNFSDGKTVTGMPKKISNNAAEVIPECNLVLIPLPVTSYESVLRDIKDHLSQGCMLGASPSSGAFDLVAVNILQKKLSDVVLFGLRPLPFNTCIKEFGKEVDILGHKQTLSIAAHPTNEANTVAKVFERLLDIRPQTLTHFIICTIGSSNTLIRPMRLYSCFKDHTPDKTYDQCPFFYKDMDEDSVKWIQSVDEEINGLCKKIDGIRPELKVCEQVGKLPETLDQVYGNQIKDRSSLLSRLRTNTAYQNIKLPMRQTDKGWVPDLNHRYFKEDIPALVVVKGIAELLDCKTPNMDRVILWAQKLMGKEYISQDGRLQGRNLNEVNAPQKFGYRNLEDILGAPRRAVAQM